MWYDICLFLFRRTIFDLKWKLRSKFLVEKYADLKTMWSNPKIVLPINTSFVLSLDYWVGTELPVFFLFCLEVVAY